MLFEISYIFFNLIKWKRSKFLKVFPLCSEAFQFFYWNHSYYLSYIRKQHSSIHSFRCLKLTSFVEYTLFPVKKQLVPLKIRHSKEYTSRKKNGEHSILTYCVVCSNRTDKYSIQFNVCWKEQRFRHSNQIPKMDY